MNHSLNDEKPLKNVEKRQKAKLYRNFAPEKVCAINHHS
jgi:hypothetical protein